MEHEKYVKYKNEKRGFHPLFQNKDKVDFCHRSVNIHNLKFFLFLFLSSKNVCFHHRESRSSGCSSLVELSDRVMCSGNRNNFLASLNRQKWLFYSCLTSIIFFFVSLLYDTIHQLLHLSFPMCTIKIIISFMNFYT